MGFLLVREFLPKAVTENLMEQLSQLHFDFIVVGCPSLEYGEVEMEWIPTYPDTWFMPTEVEWKPRSGESVNEIVVKDGIWKYEKDSDATS